MKVFGIYEHPDNGLEAVKKGFSWPGFFFGFFWAIYKKFWVGVAIILGLKLVIYLISSGIHVPDERTAEVVGFAGNSLVWIIPGLFGNKWYASHLIRNGYKLIDTVNVTGTAYPETALAEYKNKRTES